MRNIITISQVEVFEKGSFKISMYKPLGVDSIRVAKAQQKRLYSFILYSYSIEFITLPMFVNACANVFCISAGCESDFLASYFKMILNLIIYYFYEAEIVAIASSEFNTDRSLKAAIIVHPGDVNQAA
ncbi:Uncharacterized protein BM_BM11096 [Brugia malayi]|uniref:Bm11096 n=1 Tax=Brugia malayi TaxID=6279 RepID=A0A0K0IQL6_BRUMA|nr:Uncharacterized protein BM_BM11096 [Brugia malayi]CDQ01252.1 Bm11096 [Brugia malayi]VIO92741.1 Uncharacterized protein BM_BM11096 [Brugia malayi]